MIMNTHNCLRRIPAAASRFFLPAVLILFLAACDKPEVTEVQPAFTDTLQKHQVKFTLSKADLQAVAILLGGQYNISSTIVIYDVEVYDVEYSSKSFDSSNVTASGITLVPITDEPVAGIASVQHGTVTFNSEAPSSLSSTHEFMFYYALLASTGLVVTVPDYIGFGTTSNIPHPYYVYEASVHPVVDNLYAAYSLAGKLGRVISNSVVLVGYSQGGYVSMATQKYMENKNVNFFKLIGTYAGAGGYDLLGMLQHFQEVTTYENVYFLGYVIHAYVNAYNLPATTYSEVFKSPFDQAVQVGYDGTKTGSQINATLSTTVADFLQPAFLTDPQAAAPRIYELLDTNGLPGNWSPSSKLVMFHGVDDTDIPLSNSISVFERLGNNSNVTLLKIIDADHQTGIIPFASEMLMRIPRDFSPPSM